MMAGRITPGTRTEYPLDPSAKEEKRLEHLRKTDPETVRAIADELNRQKRKIELIASENFVSRAVLEALGTVLTNKYAEGYPGKRYYGGCEYVDRVEELARERAKKLFGAEHANVQPHSGAQANMGVYFAVLEPGDTVLGMNLAHGGHLTHGSPVNFSGTLYKFVSYGVDEKTHRIDYDEVRRLALEHRPKLLVAGASAYPRVIDFARLREIADEAGCLLMVDMAHIAGLVATGHHPNPVPYADFVTTTTHKTPARPPGRHDPVQGGVRQEDRQGDLPRHPGWAPDARHRGQGGGLGGGPDGGFQGLFAPAWWKMPPAWPKPCRREGLT